MASRLQASLVFRHPLGILPRFFPLLRIEEVAESAAYRLASAKAMLLLHLDPARIHTEALANERLDEVYEACGEIVRRHIHVAGTGRLAGLHIKCHFRFLALRISANLDSDFGVIRTAVSVIANAIGAQATLDEYMVA